MRFSKFSSFYVILMLLSFSCFFGSDPSSDNNGKTIDHMVTDLTQISDERIENAKQKLHIAYGHTSHGSQLITGMSGLADFLGDKYAFNNDGNNGALELRDRPFEGAADLGNPNRTAWASALVK